MKNSQIFEEMHVFNDKVVLDGKEYKAKVGKHEIWIPDLELKFVWTYNGKIEAYRDWDKGRNAEALKNGTFNTDVGFIDKETKNSILNEYMIFEALSKPNMAPPVCGFVFVKSVTSETLGYTYCDPIGMYGFCIRDANLLPKGLFTPEKFVEYFLKTGIISASPGAVNDIYVPKRNNIVNGYLIDVRRTIWDMMRINKEWEDKNPLNYNEKITTLRKKIEELGQFPFKERKTPYQSYYLNDVYKDGSRDTLYRYEKMKIGLITPLEGKSLVDLGCCYGAMCIEAFKRGARNILGMDNQVEYIQCARDLARANHMPMNFLCCDMEHPLDVLQKINSQFPNGVDVVFALSLYKHVGDNLWAVLNGFEWEICYLESNNAPKDIETDHVREMVRGIERFGYKAERFENTEDRSPRVLWRLRKK